MFKRCITKLFCLIAKHFLKISSMSTFDVDVKVGKDTFYITADCDGRGNDFITVGIDRSGNPDVSGFEDDDKF